MTKEIWIMVQNKNKSLGFSGPYTEEQEPEVDRIIDYIPIQAQAGVAEAMVVLRAKKLVLEEKAELPTKWTV